MKSLHISLLLGTAIVVTFPLIGTAANLDRGRLLYENHCIGCHECVVHVREQRHVTTPTGLRQAVRDRAELSGVSWSPEEIDDVVLYLDQRYYKFDAGPRGG